MAASLFLCWPSCVLQEFTSSSVGLRTARTDIVRPCLRASFLPSHVKYRLLPSRFFWLSHHFHRAPQCHVIFQFPRHHQQHHRLLDQGYSIETIASATLEADNISKGRNISASKTKWDGVNEMSERFGRFFRRSVGRRHSALGSSTMVPTKHDDMASSGPMKQSIAANSA